MIDIRAAKNEVLDWISKAVRRPPEDIDVGKPLAEVGLDSNDAVHLVCTIEAALRTELPEDVMSGVATVGDILKLMDVHIQSAGAAPGLSPA